MSSYAKKDVLDAVSEGKAKLLTTREAARKCGVPLTTIMNSLKGIYSLKIQETRM